MHPTVSPINNSQSFIPDIAPLIVPDDNLKAVVESFQKSSDSSHQVMFNNYEACRAVLGNLPFSDLQGARTIPFHVLQQNSNNPLLKTSCDGTAIFNAGKLTAIRTVGHGADARMVLDLPGASTSSAPLQPSQAVVNPSSGIGNFLALLTRSRLPTPTSSSSALPSKSPLLVDDESLPMPLDVDLEKSVDENQVENLLTEALDILAELAPEANHVRFFFDDAYRQMTMAGLKDKMENTGFWIGKSDDKNVIPISDDLMKKLSTIETLSVKLSPPPGYNELDINEFAKNQFYRDKVLRSLQEKLTIHIKVLNDAKDNGSLGVTGDQGAEIVAVKKILDSIEELLQMNDSNIAETEEETESAMTQLESAVALLDNVSKLYGTSLPAGLAGSHRKQKVVIRNRKLGEKGEVWLRTKDRNIELSAQLTCASDKVLLLKFNEMLKEKKLSLTTNLPPFVAYLKWKESNDGSIRLPGYAVEILPEDDLRTLSRGVKTAHMQKFNEDKNKENQITTAIMKRVCEL